nr:hypothetical protein [Pandoravirus massiliensis]
MISARTWPVYAPPASKKRRTVTRQKDTGGAHCDAPQQQHDQRAQEIRLDDLPGELVRLIATHVDAADVLAVALVNRHLAASVNGTLRAAAIGRHTLLRRLRLFVLCVSHAVAAGHVTAVRLVRPFVVGDLGPRQCVMAITRDCSVHWVWMTTRGGSVRYGDWRCAVDLARNSAHLLALHQHITTEDIKCIVTSDEGPPSGSAIARALWTAVAGSYPPPDLDKRLQKKKGLGPCDRSVAAVDVWERWSTDPAAAEAFVREAALCPLAEGTAPE